MITYGICPSNKTSCRTCHNIIRKGETRVVEEIKGTYHPIRYYWCLTCGILEVENTIREIKLTLEGLKHRTI